MSFNLDKCVIMHLGSHNFQYQYELCNHAVKTTECERYIGVHMHTSLKPSAHIGEIVKKANQALRVLLQCFTFRDKFHYIHLYKTYVRCHHENSVLAWSPWTTPDISNTETVQKLALRCCQGSNGHSYKEKLKEVSLTTLLQRRHCSDMLETFKNLKDINDVYYHTSFSRVHELHQRTRQAFTVKLHY